MLFKTFLGKFPAYDFMVLIPVKEHVSSDGFICATLEKINYQRYVRIWFNFDLNDSSLVCLRDA